MSEKKNKTYESMQEANAELAAIDANSRKKKRDINESMHEANEQIGGI